MRSVSTMRLYGAAIALASGVYSVGASMGGPMGMAADWLMLAIGLLVVVHGAVLLTPLAEVLGRVSGPLMGLWAVVMLANQALAGGMGPMRIDGGMVALALLMLVSGLIMTTRAGSDRPM